MLRKKGFILIVSCFLFFNGFSQQSAVIQNYIKSYRVIAIEEMQRTGVPAAIKLAQGIHESMWGQSELVLKSNNHFGIKCKSGYTGPYVLHDDDAPNERFMKYDNPEQSYIDHSDFLRGRERYASLFTLDPTDYKGWANGLKKAGYATNPKYPQIIINIIEKYNLNDYTLIGLGKMEMPDDLKEYTANRKSFSGIAKKSSQKYPEGDFKINDTRVVYVKKGTSYFNLAIQYNIAYDRIYDFNDLPLKTGAAEKDRLIYLQLKRTVGQKDFHVVQKGEDLFDIAQTEGIRLDALLKYNNLTKTDTPAAGSKVYLRDRNGDSKIAVN